MRRALNSHSVQRLGGHHYYTDVYSLSVKSKKLKQLKIDLIKYGLLDYSHSSASSMPHCTKQQIFFKFIDFL